jgi:hypothetical protein
VRQLARALGRKKERVQHEQRDDLTVPERVSEGSVIGETKVLASEPNQRPSSLRHEAATLRFDGAGVEQLPQLFSQRRGREGLLQK